MRYACQQALTALQQRGHADWLGRHTLEMGLEGGLELMRQTLVQLGYDEEETTYLSLAVRDIHYQAATHPVE